MFITPITYHSFRFLSLINLKPSFLYKLFFSVQTLSLSQSFKKISAEIYVCFTVTFRNSPTATNKVCLFEYKPDP